MNEMVERVARAICVSDGEDPDGKICTGDAFWMWYVPNVRTAIATLRTPTEAMIDAGFRHHDPADIWRAMCDAALKDDAA